MTDTNDKPILDTGAATRGVSVSGLFGGSTPDKEKPALKSKKFVAFLVTQICFFILEVLMVWRLDIELLSTNFAFMTVVVTQGFLAVGYILGQAALDRYVRVAKIEKHGHSGEGSKKLGEEDGDK